MDKIIVNFTPTGLIPRKQDNCHTPISVSEIVEDVLMACEMGITMVHLHARDGSSGAPSYHKGLGCQKPKNDLLGPPEKYLA